MAFLNGTDPSLRQVRTPTVDTYTAGAQFTAGSSTQVSLSADPGTENNVIITFDGITQHRDTYAVSGTTVTFDAAIATGVSKVEATYTTTIPAHEPADGSVTVGKLSTTGSPSAATFLNGSMAWATPSGGKVLQVLTATKTDTASTTSTSMGDTGLSVAITPASSSNKVLVTAMINYGQNGAAANTFFNVVRGSTALLIGDAASSRTRCTISATDVGSGNAGTATPMILDSPSTASEVTYKIQWQVQSGTTAYINREHGDSDDSNATRMGSSIIVMEISA